MRRAGKSGFPSRQWAMFLGRSDSRSCSRLVLAVAAAVVFCSAPPICGQAGWKDGRATFYGNEPWLWSIHEGHCGYGYLWPTESTGWDVAALADAHQRFSGSCGRCYEVKCRPDDITDKFGNKLARGHTCYDPEASVVVRVTDNCPCKKTDNSFSNRRWCCGDMDHLDLSIWAFEKLADAKWGVVAMSYREVPCSHKPWKPARAPSTPFPGEKPEAYGVSREALQQETSWRPEPTPNEDVYVADLGPGWQRNEWRSEMEEKTGNGPHRGPSLCGSMQPGGGVSFRRFAGAFKGKAKLEFWAKPHWSWPPELSITIAGPKGSCRIMKLAELRSGQQVDGWLWYGLSLNLFEEHDGHRVVAFDRPFLGCRGMQPYKLTEVSFRNDSPHRISGCLAGVRLVSQ